MSELQIVDHTPYPGGRYIKDGPFSGEWFRDTILRPALLEAVKRRDVLHVVLDGAPGYGSSFLEEAFGGLIRTGAFDKKTLREHLKIVARTPLYKPYKELSEKYIRNARPDMAVA